MTDHDSAVYCGKCGTDLEERAGSDPAARKPCPDCGSTSRLITKPLSAQLNFSATTQITERLSASDVTADDIRQLIRIKQRELSELEFKSVLDADLLKAACSIANFGGGFILVGVDEGDDHCASGLTHVSNVEASADGVRQRVRDGISPRPIIEVVPLRCDAKDLIVIRIAPQGAPHMVSVDKRSDFYGRYDATTERMRYEEIEQRFREKLGAGQLEITPTPTSIIATVSGRASVSQGSKEALDGYVSELLNSETPLIGLVAVTDSPSNSIDETIAISLLQKPTYHRNGGWLAAYRDFPVTHKTGLWQQDYGDVGATAIGPSGDIISWKTLGALVHNQTQAEFERSPRLYPNTIIEYCLSFCYAVADICAWAVPHQIIAKIVLKGAEGAILPLGEGGSIWFDSPATPTLKLPKNVLVSPAIVFDNIPGPIHVRRKAFEFAATIYGFFSYLERQVPFASDRKITFGAHNEEARLAATKSYLQGALSVLFEEPASDIGRGVLWFHSRFLKPSKRVAVSDEFIDDFAGDEDQLFGRINAAELQSMVAEENKDRVPLLSTEGTVWTDASR